MTQKERADFRPNLDGYQEVDTSRLVASTHAMHYPPADSVNPGYSQFLRCPLPIISSTSDGLRQFYRNSGVPLYRLVPPGSL